MTKRRTSAIFAGLIMLASLGSAAQAATCGSGPGGFEAWKQQSPRRRGPRGRRRRHLRPDGDQLREATINADRGQRSFSLSLDAFLAKRGASTIVARGRSLKQSQAAMFASIQQRYGVPPGPLIAIWGMETGFGAVRGNQNMLSSIATLAYDCRRSEYFTDQLYAALQIDRSRRAVPSQHGSMHGEVGQTQFLPKNIRPTAPAISTMRRQRAVVDREFPESAWLARGRRLPARRSQLRGDRGVECRHGLPEGDRADGAADRRGVTRARFAGRIRSGRGKAGVTSPQRGEVGAQRRVRGRCHIDRP